MKIILISILILTSSIMAQQRSASLLILKSELSTENNSNPLISKSVIINEGDVQKKSAGLAIIYSLLLPGMGELYADGYNSGKYFTIAEGALWGTYIGMSIYANNKEDDYKSFATSSGSVNPEGKDEDYFATIGEFQSVDSYNDQQALDRNFDSMYDREQFFWKWQTTEDRKTYRNMWLSSEQTFNDLRFVVGAMILNRIASAINAVRLVSAFNSRLEEDLSWNVSVGLSNSPNLPTSLSFNFYTSF